jgi:hypothetical protein
VSFDLMAAMIRERAALDTLSAIFLLALFNYALHRFWKHAGLPVIMMLWP